MHTHGNEERSLEARKSRGSVSMRPINQGRIIGAVVAALAIAGAVLACTTFVVVPVSYPTLDASQFQPSKNLVPLAPIGAGALTDRLSFIAGPAADSGTSQTITVPAGNYVVSVASFTSSASATITTTPCGPDIATCNVEASVAAPVPASTGYSFPPAGVVPGPDVLGDGTTITFTNVTAYVITLWQYN